MFLLFGFLGLLFYLLGCWYGWRDDYHYRFSSSFTDVSSGNYLTCSGPCPNRGHRRCFESRAVKPPVLTYTRAHPQTFTLGYKNWGRRHANNVRQSCILPHATANESVLELIKGRNLARIWGDGTCWHTLFITSYHW